MSVKRKIEPMTVAEFLTTDQALFGPAWRYDLVDGQIVAHAAPSPDHGAIISALSGALHGRLRGSQEGCRAESGSAAVTKDEQRRTARIPDVMIRCGSLPRVIFEVVSPSELTHWRARNRKRSDLQRVEGVVEIIEIYIKEAAIHAYRLIEGRWTMEEIEGLTSSLVLPSIGIEVSLAEIYETVELHEEPGPW